MSNVEREIAISPDLGPATKDFVEYCKEVRKALARHKKDNDLNSFFTRLRVELDRSRKEGLPAARLRMLLAKSIVLDLLGLGWAIKMKRGSVVAIPPSMENTSSDDAKSIVRKGHLVERDAQLSQDAVREFIRKMEARRLTSKGWHSIFSLMRDGKDLADKLKAEAHLNNSNKEDKVPSHAIQPYLQFVDEEPECKYTGLDLREVWRYFRHTWVNAYKSLPGRSMIILIRDAGAENHPVIGIAALGSAIVQQRLRDVWIGWDEDTIVKEMIAAPTSTTAKWLLKSLDEQIAGIYAVDLYRDKLCNSLDIDHPTDIVIDKLNKEAKKAIEQHRKYPNAAAMKAKDDGADDSWWESQAQTKLFRSKRCETLASLLKIRQIYHSAGFRNGTKKEFESVLKDQKVVSAIRQLVRMVKGKHVGINMMDIVVCGAIPPYNALLGGKLVCMLLCSPEVVEAYAKKYGEAVSIIASSMKGEALVRKPQLVLLTTTSLYGRNSSQYNRIKMPCEDIGGTQGEYIEYKEIGKSEGYGTYQFSEITLELMKYLLARNMNGRKVNSIFGEGVNPRMRKIRDGLALLSLSADELLMHGNPRIVYAVKLANNCRNVLLGKDTKPHYIVPLKNARKKSEKITEFWRRRWLLGRIKREDVLSEVSKHGLSYPIVHGARVVLPANEEETGSLLL